MCVNGFLVRGLLTLSLLLLNVRKKTQLEKRSGLSIDQFQLGAKESKSTSSLKPYHNGHGSKDLFKSLKKKTILS